MGLKWYQGVSRGQWMALAAALLGWMFDGFEQGIFPRVARPALTTVLSQTQAKGPDGKVPGEPSVALSSRSIDNLVGLWNGRITAAWLLGAAFGGWTFGWLGDRIGRIRAMVFSVLTYSVFTGLCGLAQSAWQLAELRFLAALGMGGEWALGVALVMESWQASSRPVLAGLIGAAANVGFILTAFAVKGVQLAGVKLQDNGWRWVLGTCALPALLTFFIRMFVPESEKWQRAVQTGPRARFTDTFSRGLWKRTLVGALLGSIALIGTWGSVQWVALWVDKITSGNQNSIDFAVMALGFGAVIGTISAPVLGRNVPRRWVFFFLCLGSVVSCAWLFRYFDGTNSVDGPFLASAFVVGIFTAAFYGWLPLYLPELFPTRLRAMGQGFSYNAGRIIAAGGAVSTGLLMSEKVFNGNYAKAGATISLVYLVGLFVIWLAPETRGKPLPE